MFDKSHLSIDTAYETGLVHKDYIAHCHRWNYVVKYLQQSECGAERYKSAIILDIGCGKDLPLYKVLCTNKFGNTPKYIGVDINKLSLPEKFANRKLLAELHSETDVCSLELNDKPNLIVSFEMLEHVPRDYSQDTLHKAYELSSDDATAIISTPVYYDKYGMAANHINEMTREELIDQIIEAGWKVVKNYGTFSTRKDLYPYLSEEHKKLYDELNEYYCSHVMSTIFAPLYPQYSRNNLWVLKKRQ